MAMAGEQLRVTEGIDRGAVPSVDSELLIGRRSPHDEGRLGGDPEISRRHARVSRGADGQLVIEDLGSVNGTFVNDERIDAPRLLQAGDLIRVGRTVLQVTAGVAAAPAESQPPVRPSASVSAEPDHVLLVRGGDGPGRRLALRDELLIGREVRGEGRLSDDPQVSRRHARIARAASGELTVEDLESANGTFVNEERVHGRHVLSVGDSIRVGATILELTEAAPAPASPPADASSFVPAEPLPPRPGPTPVPASGQGRLAPELAPGTVFAGCRIDDVINHGDMGIVYRAEELALQRPVALKLILPEYSSEERFRERFRRESRIAAAIDHPHVIPIFDAGEEDGLLYIMMRLVHGTDMRAVIAAEGHLEPRRAASIVQQVGSALDAAHARGMLHRDVKPSNVLLARRDHVYLSDFGLAKLESSGERLTRHGTIVARAEYVSPEQIMNQRVDARADIYALGCLLYEALTGEAPFATAASGQGPLAHLEAPPPSPSDLRPELPREFDEVVHRAMAKDPSDRYPSAGDLGQAALVAAGTQRRASAESIVATGAAAPLPERPARRSSAGAAEAPARRTADTGRPDLLRWGIALAGLAIVAAGMVAALIGISSL